MDKLKKQIENTLALRSDLVDNIKNEDDMIALITQYVQELIDYDFEKLLLLLYRIDVNESKVKKAIDANGPNLAAKSIAQLIFNREKEKMETRQRFNDNQTNDWEF